MVRKLFIRGSEVLSEAETRGWRKGLILESKAMAHMRSPIVFSRHAVASVGILNLGGESLMGAQQGIKEDLSLSWFGLR